MWLTLEMKQTVVGIFYETHKKKSISLKAAYIKIKHHSRIILKYEYKRHSVISKISKYRIERILEIKWDEL